MPDKESRTLDREIFAFMRRYGSGTAPEIAFELLALRIFEYQFRRNVHYHKFCEMENVAPGRIQNWRDIPAMPALAFKELVLAAFPLNQKVRVFRTSGTTGSWRGASATKASADAPPRGAHFFDTMRLYDSAIISPFEKYVLGPPSATKALADGAFAYYFLITSAANAPYSSLSHMMHVVNRRFATSKGKFYVRRGLPCFQELALDLKKEKNKTLLLSTAFALKGFLDFLSARKIRIRLAPGSRLMETGGFKGQVKEISKQALYAQCGSALGISKKNCVSEYGMTELSSQMYATAPGVFTGPAWLKTSVIDPRTGKEALKGKIGILRHVDLANRGSVLAVQTEDLGRETGRGFELLGRAKGSELRGCSLTYEKFIRRGE